MYKLYWTKHCAAMGPQAMLEEGNIPYEVIEVDFRKGENRKPEYLKISPLGFIPSLELEDGWVMYETPAMMMHLAEKHKMTDLVPDVDDPDRPLFLRSLFYMVSSQQYHNRLYYNPHTYYGPDDKEVHEGIKKKANETLWECWSTVNDHLLESGGPFYLGERYSMLDLYVLMMTTWFVPFDGLLEKYPAVKRCCEEAVKRPANQKMLKQHGLEDWFKF